MDFQPTAQPLVAGLGWSRRARLDLGLGRAGGDGGGAVNPSVGAWPRHPCRGHPVIPARPASDTFRRFRPPRKEKEEQEQRQKLHSGWLPAGPTPYPLRSDRSPPRMAWIYRVDQGRHLPTVTGRLSKAGRCGLAGPLAPWMAPSSPRDGFTACPANPHRPAQHAETQSRFGFGPWLWLRPLRVQGATLQRRRPPFGGLTSLYFSLISRRRSSRKPWAVIASGYRLGFSGVMQDGSTSIRKSGFGCRKNGTE